jgi:preprotein translocase subunit SecG
MTAILIVIHVLVCVFLIISILLQSSKGGGLAGMFGGGGGGMGVFGARGAASFLSKVTMWLGIGLGVTTIIIALLSVGNQRQSQSMLEQVSQQEQASSPAAIIPTVPEESGDIIPQEPVSEPEGE